MNGEKRMEGENIGKKYIEENNMTEKQHQRVKNKKNEGDKEKMQ
jgi:hypothetical protein